MAKAGDSKSFHGQEDFSLYLTQAREALRLGNKYAPHFWHYRFEDYAYAYLLERCAAPFGAWQVVSPALQILRDYDRKKEGDLYHTLQIHLQTGCNVTQSADRLGIHRTSMIKRLNRIKKLTGIRLEEADTRLYLMLSYKILNFPDPRKLFEIDLVLIADLIHDNIIDAREDTSLAAVGQAGNKASAGGVFSAGSGNFFPDHILFVILQIHNGGIQTSHKDQLSFCFFLDSRNVILRQNPLPYIHVDIDHIFRDGLAVAVGVMDNDHALALEIAVNFLVTGFQHLPPHFRRHKEAGLGAPVIVEEHHVRMKIFTRIWA